MNIISAIIPASPQAMHTILTKVLPIFNSIVFLRNIRPNKRIVINTPKIIRDTIIIPIIKRT